MVQRDYGSLMVLQEMVHTASILQHHHHPHRHPHLHLHPHPLHPLHSTLLQQIHLLILHLCFLYTLAPHLHNLLMHPRKCLSNLPLAQMNPHARVLHYPSARNIHQSFVSRPCEYPPLGCVCDVFEQSYYSGFQLRYSLDE
jgi:hypothetical protein